MPPSLPPIADPYERDGLGTYDTDELDAIKEIVALFTFAEDDDE